MMQIASFNFIHNEGLQVKLKIGSFIIEFGRIKMSLKEITIPPQLWFAVLVAVIIAIYFGTF